MRRSTLVLLASLALFAVFLGLEPLLTYAVWGSDTGEYYSLTNFLVQHGSFELGSYTGWGSTGYQYFPGTFEVGAAVAGATGADPLLSLEIAIPALAALSVLPLFLLFRRFVARDDIALLGAALAAVAMPRLFDLSHAAPLALGDFLAVATLWAFVEQRRDPRWIVVFVLSGGALIFSHHLSSYFFLVSALGLLVGLELFAPRRWSIRYPLREFFMLGGFVVALFAFWIGYTRTFVATIVSAHVDGVLLPAEAFPAGALIFIALLGYLVHLRRTRAPIPALSLKRLRWPNRFRLYRDALVLGIAIFGGLAILLVVPLPSTGVEVTPFELLWYTPVLLLVPLAAGGRALVSFARLGMAPYLWLLGVGLSALVMLATNNSVISPERHAEYLVIPLGFAAAVALGRLIGSWRAAGHPRAWVAGVMAVLLLVGANAVIAYPPPVAIAGFQEGFTPQDLALASWASASLGNNATLASDHRLSDLYFGLSGQPATWDTTPALFNGNDSLLADQELDSSYAPHCFHHIDAVAVDATMVQTGVALNPSDPAVPMSSAALDRLGTPTFALLYQSGSQEVWWVTGAGIAYTSVSACPS